ncbi:MAG: hypothetical protein RLN81_01500 [Balneolaceae bacterium]
MNMETDNTNKPGVNRKLPLIIIAVGVVLMILMIIFEDEPGGIPVLLIVFGIGWHVTTWLRSKSQSNSE